MNSILLSFQYRLGLFASNDDGQDLMEWVLVAMCLSLTVISALQGVANAMIPQFSKVAMSV